MVLRTAVAAVLALTPLASASAGRLDEARVVALLEELAPVVEAEAGRSFAALPPLVMADRHDIAEVFYAEQVHLMGGDPHGESDPEVHRAARASTMAMARAFIGKYGFLDGKLYFAADQLYEALESRGIDPILAEPLAEVALSHELAHALQDQEIDLEQMVSTRADGDGITALSCVVEGHAVWVQEQVGRATGNEAAVELMAQLLGHRHPPGAPRTDPDRFYRAYVYGAGRDFMAWHATQGGVEHTWDVLATPPTRSVTITHPHTYGEPDPEPPPPALRSAVLKAGERLGARRWRVDDERVGDFDLREELVARCRDDRLAERWVSGWRARAVGGPDTGIEVQVLTFDDAVAARHFVEHMRRNAQMLLADALRTVPGALPGPRDIEGSVTAFTPLDDDISARESISLQLGGPVQSLGTVWVARGARVVQVVTRNHTVGDRRLARAIDHLLEAGDQP